MTGVDLMFLMLGFLMLGFAAGVLWTLVVVAMMDADIKAEIEWERGE